MECELCEEQSADFECQCISIHVCQACLDSHIAEMPAATHTTVRLFKEPQPLQETLGWLIEEDDESDLIAQAKTLADIVQADLALLQQLKDQALQEISQSFDLILGAGARTLELLSYYTATDIYDLRECLETLWPVDTSRIQAKTNKYCLALRSFEFNTDLVRANDFAVYTHYANTIYKHELVSREIQAWPTTDKFSSLCVTPYLLSKVLISGTCKESIAKTAYTNMFAKYNPEKNQLKKLAPYSVPRLNHSALVSQGKLYLFGGTWKQESLNSVESFNFVTAVWTQEPPLIVPRSGCGVCALNGKIYIVGGCQSSQIEIRGPEERSTVQLQRPIPTACSLAPWRNSIFVFAESGCCRIEADDWTLTEVGKDVTFRLGVCNPVVVGDKICVPTQEAVLHFEVHQKQLCCT